MSGGSDTAATARRWDQVAHVYDAGVPFFTVLGARLVDAIDPQPGERILDVGSGRGACLFPAAERVAHGGFTVGSDLSFEMMAATASELAARHVDNGVVITADARALGFKDRSFDAVVCSQAIGEIGRADGAAREFWRVLCDGGRIGIQRDIANDPRWEFTNHEYLAFLDRLEQPPEPPPTVDVVGSLSDAGFTGIEQSEEVVEFTFPSEAAWWALAWTTGAGRRCLQPLPEDAREEYRNVVFERMQDLKQADGFPMALTFERVVARR